MNRIYLDNAAATPLHPVVYSAMNPWLKEKFGNPSSIHHFGQEAKSAIEDSRFTVSKFFSCKPTEIFFTDSGTSSCNWALFGLAEKRLLSGHQAHIIISSIEHSSILRSALFLEQAYGVRVSYIPVDKHGIVSPEDILQQFTEDTLLVSIMSVNNEIGSLQPLEKIGEICKDRGVLFHTDACQAVRYVDLNVDSLHLDLLSMSASKISGPKGVGVLYIREGTDISPWTFGGSQEFRIRAGTENVPAIVGLGKALELIQREEQSFGVSTLRDQLWDLLEKFIPKAQRNGSPEFSSPHILNIFLPNCDGETLVRRLDLKGFAISSGSACSSGLIEPSHVIMALGYDASRAKSSIRVSLSPETTQSDIRSFSELLSEIYSDLIP